MRALLKHLSCMRGGDAATLQVVRFLKCKDRFHCGSVEDAVYRAAVKTSFPERLLNKLDGSWPVRVIYRSIKPRDQRSLISFCPNRNSATLQNLRLCW